MNTWPATEHYKSKVNSFRVSSSYPGRLIFYFFYLYDIKYPWHAFSILVAVKSCVSAEVFLHLIESHWRWSIHRTACGVNKPVSSSGSGLVQGLNTSAEQEHPAPIIQPYVPANIVFLSGDTSSVQHHLLKYLCNACYHPSSFSFSFSTVLSFSFLLSQADYSEHTESCCVNVGHF